MKKLLSLFTAALILFSASSTFVHADNTQDRIAESKLRFEQVSDDIVNVNKEISALNSRIDKLRGTIKKNNENIEKNNKLIETEKKNMEKLENEVNAVQESANIRLRAMYINSYSESFFTLLVSAESFSDFFDRLEAVRRIVSLDKKILNDLGEKKKALDKAIENLNSKKQELERLKKSNEDSLSKINEDKLKLEALVSKYEQEKAAAAKIIKENEEKLIAHAVSAIDSSSSISDVKNALQTLKSLLPQLSTASVKNKAEGYIASGTKKLNTLLEEEAKRKAEAEKAAASTTESPSRGGDSNNYKATYTMTATAYSGGTLTAMGLKPIRDPNGLSTIAVDPSVIPLGTKVHVPGYGYAIASDTGGAIKGNIIDLYMNSEEECFRWGRRPVTVHIIAYPGQW